MSWADYWKYIEWNIEKIFFHDWTLYVKQNWKINAYWDNENFWVVEVWVSLYWLYLLRELTEEDYHRKEEQKQKQTKEKLEKQEYLRLKKKFWE